LSSGDFRLFDVKGGKIAPG